MPTTIWSLEADVERFLEATEPALAALPREAQLECPFCSRFFSGVNERLVARDVARHVGRDHPLKRPVLVVGGHVLGPNTTIARLPACEDVEISNATSIEACVDGAAPVTVTADEARNLVVEAPRRMLHLRLVNGRSEDSASAAVEHRIKIDVASDRELHDVDAAFLHYLAREDATRSDVMRFSNDTDGIANFYRDGLVSYVLGVFAKDDHDGADAHVLERGLDNIGRSAHHLASFQDRRVAAAVLACARFNLNELTPVAHSTGVAAIDAVSAFLVALATGVSEPPWPRMPQLIGGELRCPVDEATYSLLDVTFALAEDRSGSLLNAHVERLEHAALTTGDRAKLAAVLGERAYRTDRNEVARRCADALYNDAVFEAVTKRWSPR